MYKNATNVSFDQGYAVFGTVYGLNTGVFVQYESISSICLLMYYLEAAPFIARLDPSIF